MRNEKVDAIDYTTTTPCSFKRNEKLDEMRNTKQNATPKSAKYE
jgi:hypothetical protein